MTDPRASRMACLRVHIEIARFRPFLYAMLKYHVPRTYVENFYVCTVL